MRRMIYAVISGILLSVAVGAAVTWDTITGPVSETADQYNHIGTDGTSLYVVFANNQLWRYSFTAGAPLSGTWTRLADPPRTVNAWDSYSDLACQSGYLCTSALPSSGGGRTLLRYKIATDTWEIWQTGGVDLTISNTSGNAMFMDPTQAGVGYSAWHAGFWWVGFDWSARTANNSWMSTGGLGVADAGWVSRNEDVATNGVGVYYATKNDWTAGLSSGDVVYTWTGLSSPTPSVLAAKPWQAGFGQSLEFIPGSNSPSGHDELWLIRGSDASSGASEGWGNPTSDWAQLDLANVGAGWTTGALPGTVGYQGEIVFVQGSVFVRGTGDEWYVTTAASSPGSPISISDAKKLTDGSPVEVEGVGSAVFSGDTPPRFYIQSTLRPCGIQVRYSSAPTVGQPVGVSGQIQTDTTTRERYIQAASWSTKSGTPALKPLALNTRALGGGQFGLQDPVFDGRGLNNVGLLVKISGAVTGKATDGSYVYVSDGSGAADGTGPAGVRVDLIAISPLQRPSPLVGDKVIITGISSMYLQGGHCHRMVRARSASDFRNLSDDGNRPKVFKVFVINFDPIIESRQNKRLHELYGWGNPSTLAQGYINDLKECSGNWAQYQIVEWVDADYYPIKTDGFQYTDDTFTYAWEHGGPFHSPDGANYYKIISDRYYSYNNPKTVAERIASGEVDEVFMFGAPYFGYYESQMMGPTAYWCNSPGIYLPAAGRNFVVMGFNYERGVDCMLEDYGHRTESIMSHVYGSWNAYPPQHNWDYFTLINKNIQNHTLYTAGCGNVHYAPNSQSDYEWGNMTFVWSTCDDWLNNWPNLQGTKKRVNCTEWGGGDMRLHHRWWFKHIPKKPGVNPDGKQNNWWKYLADFNSYPESR